MQRFKYLFLALVVVYGIAMVVVNTNHAKEAQTASTSTTAPYVKPVSITRQGLTEQVNEFRTSKSLPTFQTSTTLELAAENKCKDMASRDYWSHNTPDGEAPWSFLVSTGYDFVAAGENLAFGWYENSEVVSEWVKSPTHLANLVGNYTEVGYGICSDDNYQGAGQKTIVVQMMGTPAS